MPRLNHHRSIFKIVSLLLLISVVSACTPDQQTQVTPSDQSSQAVLQAEVVFNVTVPPGTPSDQYVFIDVLDEVTGLGLNPLRYSMKPVDPSHFSIHLPAALGSVIKYRYVRGATPPIVEYTTGGNQVRYRMAYITGPKTIQDTINAWSDVPYHGPTGRINGQVVDQKTNVPEPNVLVAAGGLQVMSASDGTFLIDGLQPGIHNLLVYSPNGQFEPYQQEAQVAADSMTPVPVSVVLPPKVKVTFIASPPAVNPRGIPVRMAGNILQFGNTFADLAGGMNVLASRAPLMSILSDGRYSLTMELPAGLDLRYKYTVGDGFWNSELTAEGQFQIRQVIIPDHDITVDDQIATWQSKDFGAITFNLKVSAGFPDGETVSIQFNPYGWTEPIPMWPLGNGKWFYVLYNPLQLLDQVTYRFCRNDQCGIADANTATSGDLSFSPQSTPQVIDQEVTRWVWWKPSSSPVTVVAPQIQARQPDFIAGVELIPQYRPGWLPYFAGTLKDIQTIHANWTILSPTWTFTSVNPPILEPVAGKDAFWQDMIAMSAQVTQGKLGLAIFPTVDLGPNSDGWWATAQKDPGWWQSWFDRYREFILNYADLAQQVNANALILGDPGVQQALPGASETADGVITSSPDAEKRWVSLIQEVRARFKGQLIWAIISHSGNLTFPPDFLGSVDQIYVLVSAPAGGNNGGGSADYLTQAQGLLDNDVLPLKNKLNKPVLVGIDYASVAGAERGCVLDQNNDCMAFSQLAPPYLVDVPGGVDLQVQVDIYHAFLTAINDRPWVDGFITRGYYPPVPLQDKSSSVHGKPASDLLWFWFSQMLPTK